MTSGNRGVNAVNDDGDTGLIIASERGRLDIVKMLLCVCADISIQNKKGITAFYVACRNNHLPVVDFLLEEGPDINVTTHKGVTPLMAACQNNHEKIVRILTDEDADCKLVTKQGTPALAFAIQNKHHKVAEFLLDVANVPPDYPTCESLLILAVKTRQESTVKSLLEAGADPNRRSKMEGLTALLHAVDLPIVKLLLEHGADPGATDAHGGNALHIAAARIEGDSGIFLALQAGGVDPCALDNSGHTPLDIASLHGNDTAALVLVNLQPSETHINNNNKKASTHTSSRIYSSDSIARGIKKEENRKKNSRFYVNVGAGGASIASANHVNVENEKKKKSLDEFVSRVSLGSTHSSSTSETASRSVENKQVETGPVKSESVPEKVPEKVPERVSDEEAHMKEDTRSAGVASNYADILDNTDIHIGEKECDLSASMGTKLPEEFPCANCGTLTRKKCARCKTDYFCARECQKAAYAGHKARCLELHEERLRAKEERAARKSNVNTTA